MYLKVFLPIFLLLLPGLIHAEEKLLLPETVITGEDRSRSKLPSLGLKAAEGTEGLFLPEPPSPRPEKIFSSEMEIEGGDNQRKKFFLKNKVFEEEKFNFETNFFYKKEGGYRANSDFELFDFFSFLELGLSEEEKIALRGNYFWKESGLPGKIDALTLNNRGKSKAEDVTFKWEKFFPAENSWKGKVSYQNSWTKNSKVSSRYRNEKTLFQLGYEDAPFSFLTFFSQERLADCYKIEDYYFSLGMQDLQITPVFYADGLLKAEKRKGLGTLFLPELKISFEPSNDTAIFLKAGSFLKFQEFKELYLKENFTEVNPVILKPENEESVKLGLRKKINQDKIEFNLFNGEKKNLIIWTDGDGNGLYQPTNIKKTRFWGSQLSWEKKYCSRFTQKFLYRHQELENQGSAVSYIPYEPSDILESNLQIEADRFTFEIIGRYQNKRYYEENNSQQLPAFGVLETKLFYSLTKYAKIFLTVENLADKTYEIVKGYPSPGRRFFGGINLKF